MEKKEYDNYRRQMVAKRNDLIQNMQYCCLGEVENKAISYLLSKVQPDDDPETVYKFSCKEFYRFMRWENHQSDYDLRELLLKIANSGWYAYNEETKKEHITRWLDDAALNHNTGEIEVVFHKSMHQFIFGLQQQKMKDGIFFTSYQLQNISLLKNKYSQRLYEILKSYQYNNKQWTFELGTSSEHDLYQLIGPMVLVNVSKNKQKFVQKIPARWQQNTGIFTRDVLDPVKEEINKYTDIKIEYSLSKTDMKGVKHRKNCLVVFYMLEKTENEIKETENIINAEYKEIYDDEHDSAKEAFFKEHEDKLRIEKAAKSKKKDVPKKPQSSEESEESILPDNFPEEDADFERRFGTLSDVYPEFNKCQIKGLYYAAVPWVQEIWLEKGRKFLDFDGKQLDIVDYIDPKYNKIKATPEKTKSSTYDRLYHAVHKNY